MSSPLIPDAALANLQATAFTARCHNPFFRQKQLKALHDTLRENSSVIKDAIKQDTRISDDEATAEVAFTLDVVKEHYSSIDVKKELEQEYLIAKGKDAADKRVPCGVAYIESQQSHTPFFSAIAALSAALAAGNCAALRLDNNLRALSSLLRKLLPESLESDTFAVVSSEPPLESLSSCVQVFQEKQVNQPKYTQLVSSRSKTIAIVDRTADIAVAAEQLVTARFAFGGSSPYAPDVVLVNEFIKKDFLEHVLKHSIRFLAGSSEITNSSSTAPASKKRSPVTEALQALSDHQSWTLHTITQGDNGAIVELSNLSALPAKRTQPILAVTCITSLEHAISLIDEDPDAQQRLTAAYHFGTPSAGKYLSQFVNADVSFVNHIPFRLLLGPAAPSFYPVDIEKRYTALHFTRASPAYMVSPAEQAEVARLFLREESRGAAAALLTRARQEIKVEKRAEWIAIGYFEQGILIGLGLYGIPLVTFLGASMYFGVRAALSRWAFY